MSEIMPGFAGPSKPKCEYRVYIVANTDLRERNLTRPEAGPEGGAAETAINKLAAEGWELMPSIVQIDVDRHLLVFRQVT